MPAPRRVRTPAALPVPPGPPPLPVDSPVTCPGCHRTGTRWTLGRCDACGTCVTCCTCHQARGRMGAPYVDWPADSDLTFWGTPDSEIPRHFGVEVECGLSEFRGPLAGFVRDWHANVGADSSVGNSERLRTARPPPGYAPVNSAQACEIRTPPAAGDAARALLAGLGPVLVAHGAHVDSTCGLHVHVDARGATADDLARLALLWSKVEGALWNAVAPSRRRVARINYYCGAWGETFDQSGVFQAVTTEAKEAAIRTACRTDHNGGGKYRSLNFLPFWSHGSVEIRMHHGSVNVRKILRWATCMTQIVHAAFTQTDEAVRSLRGTPSEILDRVLDPVHARWMRARREHFAALRSRIHPGRGPNRPARTPTAEPVPVPEPEPGDGSEV